MVTKLKIDMQSGVLEVEGEQDFVNSLYQDFKSKLFENESTPVPPQQEAVSGFGRQPKKSRQTPGKTTKSKSTSRRSAHVIVKNLDLSAKGGKSSLRDFFRKKAPSKNAMEMNAVFVYYLQNEAKEKAITVDHIYTCYKHVEIKVPGALRQSIKDTSFRKGYLNTENMDNITLAVHGENLVEHDLPRQKSSNKV